MEWDIGPLGFGVLLVMSLGFGVIVHALIGRVTTRRLWLLAVVTYFVFGLLVSEVWFGWATEVELQPNIDGLSFDEALLGGLLPGVAVTLATWYVTRKPRHDRTISP